MRILTAIAVFLLQFEILHADRFGKLPPHWGQEMVFSPEAKRWLAFLAANGFEFHTASIGIIDTLAESEELITEQVLRRLGVERIGANLRNDLSAGKGKLKGHGVSILDIAASEAAQGISSLGVLDFVINVQFASYFNDDGKFIDKFDYTQVLGKSPTVLNISLSASGLSDLSKRLATHTTVVVAAGNSPFNGVDSDKGMIASRKPVLVGALNPRGRISSYSSSANADIFAPGEHRLENGTVYKGTSYATPMVVGALADMFAILPVSALVDFDDELISKLDFSMLLPLHRFRHLVVRLLQKTAMETAEVNVKVLNHYKLLRVAHRIAEQLKAGNQTAKQLIDDARTYDFALESRQLYAEAMHLAETIGLAESGAENDRGREQDVIAKLREAVALDSANAAARSELSRIYADAGFKSMAEFIALPANTEPVRLHRTTQLSEGESRTVKHSLYRQYTSMLNTPELARKYLSKELILALMWAKRSDNDPERYLLKDYLHESQTVAIERYKWRDLPTDRIWNNFVHINPFIFVINLSKDIDTANEIIDAVIDTVTSLRYGKMLLKLPEISAEIAEGFHEQVIDARVVEISTVSLVDEGSLSIEWGKEFLRVLPEFNGKKLNMLEWAILYNDKLFDLIHDDVLAIRVDVTLKRQRESKSAGKRTNAHITNLQRHLGRSIAFARMHGNEDAKTRLSALHWQLNSGDVHRAMLKNSRLELTQVLRRAALRAGR